MIQFKMEKMKKGKKVRRKEGRKNKTENWEGKYSTWPIGTTGESQPPPPLGLFRVLLQPCLQVHQNATYTKIGEYKLLLLPVPGAQTFGDHPPLGQLRWYKLPPSKTSEGCLALPSGHPVQVLQQNDSINSLYGYHSTCRSKHSRIWDHITQDKCLVTLFAISYNHEMSNFWLRLFNSREEGLWSILTKVFWGFTKF